MNIAHRMGSANPDIVAGATFEALTRLQNYTQEYQLLGACILFIKLTEYHNMDPADVMRSVSHILAKDGDMPCFKGVDLYLANEFKKEK